MCSIHALLPPALLRSPMMLLKALLLLAASLQAHVYATQAATRRGGGPVVSLDYATFEGASASGVDSFLGIPYAQSPVGNLRFRRPQHPLSLPGTTLVSDPKLFPPNARVRWKCLTFVTSTSRTGRPQSMETLASRRTHPYRLFRASTTACLPHFFRRRTHLRIVRIPLPCIDER